MLTVESSMRNVLPINMIGLAMGLHVRCGIEDNLWNQSRTGEDDHGAADRAAGAHLARVRPRGRHRQGSARDLQDRRVLRHRRGDAGRQRLRAQPPRAASRVTCARRREACRCTLAFRPSSSSPGCATTSRSTGRPCSPSDLPQPARRCAACRRWAATTSTAPTRVAAIEREAQAIDGPLVIVAHSGGVHHARALGRGRRTRARRARRAAGHAARLRAADARGLSDARGAARRRLAAGAAPAAAVPQHRRRQPQRPARPLRARRRSWRATGAAASSTSAKSAT